MVVEGLLQCWQVGGSLTVRQKVKGDGFACLGGGRQGLEVEHQQLPAPQSENPQNTGLRIFSYEDLSTNRNNVEGIPCIPSHSSQACPAPLL